LHNHVRNHGQSPYDRGHGCAMLCYAPAVEREYTCTEAAINAGIISGREFKIGTSPPKRSKRLEMKKLLEGKAAPGFVRDRRIFCAATECSRGHVSHNAT